MNIIQRRTSTKATFTFNGDNLTHSRSDIHGAHTFTLPYGSIGMDPRDSVERNDVLFTGGILLLLWGLAETLRSLLHGDLSGLLMLLPGAIACVLHRATAFTATYLTSDGGDIAILHDGQQDKILNEIKDRRSHQLLDWYGNINFANDPEDEIRKFHWLHSQNLISDDKLKSIIEAIEAHDGAHPDESDEPSIPHQ